LISKEKTVENSSTDICAKPETTAASEMLRTLEQKKVAETQNASKIEALTEELQKTNGQVSELKETCACLPLLL
jgi:hypothetical protein